MLHTEWRRLIRRLVSAKTRPGPLLRSRLTVSSLEDRTNPASLIPLGNDLLGAPSPGQQNDIQVAVRPDGSGFVSVFESDTPPAGGPAGTSNLYYQMYDSNWQAIGTASPVDPSTSAFVQENPAISIDSAGNFVIAWDTEDQFSADSSDVDARQFGPTGTPLGASFVVDTPAAGITQGFPSVSVDPSSGQFVVAWENQTGGFLEPPAQILAQAYTSDTAVPAQPTAAGIVEVNTVADESLEPAAASVAMRPDGSYVVAFEDFNPSTDLQDAFVRRIGANGTPLDASDVQLDTAFGGNTSTPPSPKVAVDSSGNYVVVWESDTANSGGTGIVQKRFRADGTLLNSSETLVNTAAPNFQQAPSVSVINGGPNDGQYVVGWQSDQDGSSFGVYYRQFDSITDGAATSGEVQINTTTSQAQESPTVSLDQAGDLVAGFEDGSNGSDVDVRVREFVAPPTVQFTSATESAGEDTGTATIGVTLTGTEPELGNLTTTVAVSNTGGTAVAGTNYSPPLPTSLTFDPTSGVTSLSQNLSVSVLDDLTYDPPGTTLTFALQASGSSPATYTLGSQASNTLTIADTDAPASITITGGNNQSVDTSQTFSNPLTVQVEDADGNPVAGVSVTFTAPASGASAVFSTTTNTITVTTDSSGDASTGSFSANATPGMNYTVTATATGGTSPSTNFTLTNQSVAPTANDQSVTLAEDATNFPITLTGSDPNNLPLTYTVTSDPTNGTLSGTAPNLFYTPAPGFFGTDSFQFTDNNGTLTSNTATVSITVVGTPTANAQSVNVAENIATPITLTGSDPNTPPLSLTYTVTSGPTNGTLSGTAPNLTYTPNAGYFGTDSFQFTDTNGTATSAPATVTITVVGTPTANSQSLTIAQDSTNDVITLTGSDPNTPALPLTYTVTSGPTNGTLSGTAPNLTYTPNAGYFGTDSFQFTDTNGTATSAPATVTITVVGTPTANSQSLTIAQDSTNDVITLTGSDPNTPALPLTYTVTSDPTHGTLSGTAPNLTYTPDAGYFGTDSFQFTDTNGTATSAPATVTITVVGTPTANAQSVTFAQDSTNDAITLTGSDPNTPALPLTYTVTSAPTHGTLSGTAPNLTYTPDAGYFGTDSFQFTDTNGTATSAPATVTITVVGTPTANAQSVTLPENAASVPITLTGSDPNTPALPLTYTVTSAPTHGTLSGTAPNLTYTPDTGYFGSDSFQFSDTNGTATSATATVSITVVGTPTANGQSVTLAEDATNFAITLTGSDPNTPALSLRYTVTSAPTHGTLSGTAPNLTYTPTAGYFGADSFQFTDTNGTATSAPATVTIIVVGKPTANAQSVTVGENVAKAVTLTATDPNATATLTYTVTSPPTHGTLSGTAPNLTYTPDAGYLGSDSFQFTASNGTATSAPATVSLTVLGIPTANAQSITTNENVAQTVTLTGSDPNSPPLPLTYTVTVSPAHGTLSGTAPNFTYIPTTDYFGPDSFQFTASNGTTTSPAATVAITVNFVNQPPTFTVGSNQTVGRDLGAETVTGWATNISAGPPNQAGQTVQFLVSNTNPSLFSVQPAVDAITGTLTYTPTAHGFGTATVTVQLMNSGGTANGGIDTSAAKTFTITVTLNRDGTTAPVNQDQTTQFTVGAGAGGPGTVTVYNGDGTVAYTVSPFPDGNGVRAVMADVTGDGVADIIAGTGPGVPAEVVVISGVTHQIVQTYFPFGSTFTGGVFVAAGDVTGNGYADIAVSPDQGGGPRVVVYDGKTGSILANFYGINDPNFRGGARVTMGDVNGDGLADLIVSAGAGGGPRIAVYNGASIRAGQTPTELVNDFYAFDPSLRNGAYVTVGDLTGDGYDDLVFGGGPGGGPRVLAYNGQDLFGSSSGQFVTLANFFAGDSSLRNGVLLAVKNLDTSSNLADLVTAVPTGNGAQVSVILGQNLTQSGGPTDVSLDLDPGLPSGVFVG